MMQTTLLKNIFFTIVSMLLISCQTLNDTPKKKRFSSSATKAIKEFQKNNQKRSKVSEQEMLDSLMPPVVVEVPELVEERFDISVKNADARKFLLGLVNSTPFNIVVSPNVDLKLTLQLKNITVSEVLSAIEKIYPISVERQNDVFYITSAVSMTSIYAVDYINLIRSGKSRTSVAGKTVTSGQGSNKNRSSSGGENQNSNQGGVGQLDSTEISTESFVDFWTELTSSLELIIKGENKASIIVSAHSGTVVVKALPKTQRMIKDYLSITQDSLIRNVIIEAKIIEVVLNDSFQSGIDWKKMYTVNSSDSFFLGQSGQTLETDESDTPLNGVLSLIYNSSSFEGAINLLQSQGDVQVLSSPRISTINNQKAVIKVGSDEFFVTDVSTTTVTGTSTATTPDVTLTPFFSGISLDVTPQINHTGEIILHIHPVISEVSDQQKTFTLGQDQFSLPLALTNVRESDSIIRTKDNQVVVIGGLMQNTTKVANSSTPFLGDIPVVGNLFKQSRESIVKSELVILLKAVIVDEKSNQFSLKETKNRFNRL